MTRPPEGPSRAPLIIVKPPKPIKEMTKDEFNTWTKAVYDEMVDRFKRAKGKAEDGPAKP